MDWSLSEVMQLAGAIGIGAFYPIQNWRLFVDRKVIGLSFLAFATLMVGVAGYIALGIRLDTPIYYAMNISNLIFAIAILAAIWFWSQSLSGKERAAGLSILVVGFSALLIVNLLAKDIAPIVSGWIGFGGIFAFYPIQNAKLFKTRDPTGLSLTAFSSLFVGLSALTIFGVLVDNVAIILGNGLTAIGTLPILYGIVAWKKDRR